MSKNLDDLLKAPARSTPKVMPPETLRAVQLLRIEAWLILALVKCAGDYYTVTKDLDRAITEASAGPDELEAFGGRLQTAREALIAAINDLSSFGAAPGDWLPVAVQRGCNLMQPINQSVTVNEGGDNGEQKT